MKKFIHIPKVSYVLEKAVGLSFARKRGITESKGESVDFLDVMVQTYWIYKVQKCFMETISDVVGDRSHLLLEKEEPIWLGPVFTRALSQGDLGNERRVLPNGNDLFVLNLSKRRSVFGLA